MGTWFRKLVLSVALIAGLVPASAQVPPPVPGLPDTERRTSYSITASTCACSVNFALYGDSTDYQNWVEVWINGAQVQYNDPLSGWTITSPTGPLASIPRPVTDAILTFTTVQTGTVQIVGARRPRRVSQFNENTGVPARNLNQVITDMVAMLREVWDKINDVTGRVILAPPGEVFTPLPPAANRAGLILCFNSSGNPKVCAPTSGGSIAQGNGISLSGTNPTTIAANLTGVAPVVVTPGTSDAIGCPTCNTTPNGTNAFIATRSAAAALNLSAYSVILTGGYAQPGDGGGATFKNVGTANFIDSFITTGTGGGSITNAGTSCTNGTYTGISLTGGHGSGAQAVIVVAGGVVTSVTITGTGGNAYQVGDVLGVATSTLGTCTGFAWTVSSVTTPTGSFTDSVGTHFQIIVGQGNYVNVRQFGAACNWVKATGDASATNDTTTIQNALNFAGALLAPTIDAGGLAGQTVILPKCYSLAGALQLPFGVKFIGQNPWSSGLKVADSLSSTLNFLTVCDPTTHLACFGSFLGSMTLFPGSGTGGSGTYMVFSNNIQQFNFMDRVAIYSGTRGCLQLVNGFGGAAQIAATNFECVIGGTTNPGIDIDLGGSQTLVGLQNFNVEAGGSGVSNNGVVITGGYVDILNFHSEGVSSAIFLNIPANSGFTGIHNISGGANCTNLITRQTGSVANVNVAGRLNANGCTNTINNAGTVTTGNVIADTVF